MEGTDCSFTHRNTHNTAFIRNEFALNKTTIHDILMCYSKRIHLEIRIEILCPNYDIHLPY